MITKYDKKILLSLTEIQMNHVNTVAEEESINKTSVVRRLVQADMTKRKQLQH